ncbi:hypothetical protein [Flavihumibacter sp. CACIAM 22H1]|uniref:hypothetical protein n=1 Tax=Flavihumibacter sp. CACIAM 22H1 TaxID=1812911 RepID=UPI0007A8BA36|nr:hypothetical protein [Flavihumibacter sp. CACIAM 22H1]KYP16004.1 MAG: hypothetical protein A1D16_07025 [Flavihumibacter sp. CACIAM 22H1]
MDRAEGNRPSITIVESHPAMQEVIKKIVESMGGRVQYVLKNDHLLLELLDSGINIDLCIIDLSPKRPAVLATITELKTKHTDILWLGISINNSERFRLRALETGLHAFYCKLEPIDRFRLILSQLLAKYN